MSPILVIDENVEGVEISPNSTIPYSTSTPEPLPPMCEEVIKNVINSDKVTHTPESVGCLPLRVPVYKGDASMLDTCVTVAPDGDPGSITSTINTVQYIDLLNVKSDTGESVIACGSAGNNQPDTVTVMTPDPSPTVEVQDDNSAQGSPVTPAVERKWEFINMAPVSTHVLPPFKSKMKPRKQWKFVAETPEGVFKDSGVLKKRKKNYYYNSKNYRSSSSSSEETTLEADSCYKVLPKRKTQSKKKSYKEPSSDDEFESD